MKLLFFSLLKDEIQIKFYKLSFDDNFHKIDSPEETHEIPEDIFFNGKEKSKIHIELYNSSKELLNKIDFQVDYCQNIIYIETDGIGKGLNFEIIFKNVTDLKVTISGKEFNSFNCIGTQNMKKLTILNYNFVSINVNNKVIYVNESIEKKDSNFVRYSLNLGDYKIIVQPSPIEDLKRPQFHLLMKKKNLFKNYYQEIEDLFLDYNKNNYKNKYHEIVNYYNKKIKESIEFQLNLSNKLLDEYFKENNIEIETIFRYIVFQLMNSGKKKYSKERAFFKETSDRLIHFYNKITLEGKLKINDKIILLYRIFVLYSLCRDMDSLNKININYFIVSECEENSIIDKAVKFYDEYVDNISEKSKVFPYLLNINSGIGYYNKEIVYSFDMINLNMIKAHLKELRPKILIFYNHAHDFLAYTMKNFPCVAVNLNYFLKKPSSKELIFDKYVKNNEESDNNTAIDLFMLFFHECMCHHKFAYNKNHNDSPKKTINESNQLIELERKCKFIEDDKEYILGGNCINKGDSGSFLELAYGKFGKDLIIHFMLKIEGKGNLLKRMDLFTGENCELLRKNLIMKFNAKERNINITGKNSIEEEIEEMEKLKISDQLLYQENKNQNQNKSQYIGKKVKRSIEENDNDDSSKDNINNKKKKYDNNNNSDNDNTFISREGELKEREEIEKRKDSCNSDDSENSDNSDNSEWEDNDKEFGKLYKKITRTYGFKEDEFLVRNIREKLNDIRLTPDERSDLELLLLFLDICV